MSDDDAWVGERVAGWLRRAADLDRQFAPVSELLFAAADLQPGESVLDVGCGAGPTTIRAAGLVGAAGRVTGLDVSAEMLAAAARAAGERRIEWLEADPVSWQPTPSWDVVLSRFGVMFFSDPRAAFGALARATRPGGRLAVVVWSRRDASEFFALPLHTVAATLGVVDLPPEDSGPFSLSGDDTVRRLLAGAGWVEATVTEQSVVLPFDPALTPAEAAAVCLDLGPTRSLVTHLSAVERRPVVAAVAARLADHADAAGQLHLAASVRVVTARRERLS